MIIYDSYHSMVRAEERANLGRMGAQKLIDRAREHGKTADQLPSEERAYLLSKSKDGCKAVYNEGYCFIFNTENSCVTILYAPKWFYKKTRFDGKTRVRNPKKYFKDCYYESAMMLS